MVMICLPAQRIYMFISSCIGIDGCIYLCIDNSVTGFVYVRMCDGDVSFLFCSNYIYNFILSIFDLLFLFTWLWGGVGGMLVGWRWKQRSPVWIKM